MSVVCVSRSGLEREVQRPGIPPAPRVPEEGLPVHQEEQVLCKSM